MKNLTQILLCLMALGTISQAQVSVGGTPRSFHAASLAAPATVTLTVVDNATLQAQADAQQVQARASGAAIPYQVADLQAVSLNLNNSGQWETLSDNSRLWRLRISSPGATAIYFRYDRWWIPKGADLFIYNDDHSEVIGAFTSSNNIPDSTNMTQPMTGDAMTLEYHIDASLSDPGALSISTVYHAFREITRHEVMPLDTFGESTSCEINANCPEGNGWDAEKHAVCLIFLPGGGICSGSLINDARNDGIPYILSAYHCYPSGTGSNFVFRFNYLSPGCSNIDGRYDQTLSNASVVARWDQSDFLLLRSFYPPPLSYSPYYAGWDRTGNAPVGALSLHHPHGDIMKVSVERDALYPADWNGQWPGSHWGLGWDAGIVEPGSSGSPWFHINTHRIIGQLHGGNSNCSGDNGPDYAGRFDWSYYGPSGGSSAQRLSDWLNPDFNLAQVWDGLTPAPPPNDECANATPISFQGNAYIDYGNTYFADNEYLNCTNHGSPQVWYKLQPESCPYQVTVDMCGSDFDTEVNVIRGTCNLFLEIVGCNDDGGTCSQSPAQARYTWNTMPGETYLIAVSGYGASIGHYEINVNRQQLTAGNDACPGFAIPALPYTNTGSTVCATYNAYFHNGPCDLPPGNTAPDVVWTFSPTCDMAIEVNTIGSNFDTILELDRSDLLHTCESAFTRVTCNDDIDFTSLQSRVTADLQAGYLYRIAVTGYNGAAGNYVLHVNQITSTVDVCPGVTVPQIPWNFNGTTACLNDNYNPEGCMNSHAPDAVYNYTPSTCHLCRVTLCSAGSYDTGIYVRAGGSCPGARQVACNDDYCGPEGYQSQVDFAAMAGITYYIYIDGFANYSGPYYGTISNIGPANPPNDVCEGETVIASLPFTDYGNTTCAADNYFNCVTNTSPEVVYSIMRPQCEIVTVSLCGSSYDTGLGIYGGTCPNIAPLIACNDDNYCGDVYTLQSTATFQAEANTNYQILVHGYAAHNGLFVINVTSVPCSIPPPPVSNVVTQLDLVSGSVSLAWSPVNYATVYHVYRSSNFATLFDSSNVVATVTETGYSCNGCMLEPATVSFFGVIAENTQGALLSEQRDITGLTKADAVQGASDIPLDQVYPVANEEHAPPSKELQSVRSVGLGTTK